MTVRRFHDSTLLIASHNKGKIAEIRKQLGLYIPRFTTASEENLPEPEETGQTFQENARLKALTAATTCKTPALADDSGIGLAALNGAPGIHSARWTGENKNYQAAVDRIFLELKGRVAVTEFVTVLALAWPDGGVVFAEGRCSGTLIPQPRGGAGFGYDAYFIPDGYDKTFAELGNTVKDEISARARAFQNLIQQCFQ